MLPSTLLVFLLISIACTITTLQTNTPKWIFAGNLQVMRESHTAVLLNDGRVMFIGGGDGNKSVDSVEIYNPADQTTQFTGSLAMGAGASSGTLLNDGRVLVIGGYNSTYQWLSRAEIYTPSLGTWEEVSPMFSHGTSHTATKLRDGRVLVVGGCYGSGLHSDSVEIFDPTTNTWEATASLSRKRCGHTATLLADGQVLIVGGDGHTGFGFENSAEIYDPTNRTWKTTGSMAQTRTLHQATLLADGRVLVVGGMKADNGRNIPLNTAEVYNPSTGLWSSAGSMSQSRILHTVTLLPNGKVLVIGGMNSYEGPAESYLSSVEVYDPTNNQWQQVAPLSVPRRSHTATLLEDGRVLVAGGWTNPTTVLSVMESLLLK
jgi:N-acetylneuraminic acid mutarotase